MRAIVRNIMFAVVAFSCAGASYAQTAPRLVRQPQYGKIERVLGDTLGIASVKPTCAEEARFGSEYCFDDVISAMRAGGIASMPVLAVRSDVQAGQDAQGVIFDVAANAGSFTATSRADGRVGVRIPRNCYALPGEGVRYGVEQKTDRLGVTESQLIVCDGAAPPQPWTASSPPRATGEGNSSPQGYWPVASTPLVTGTPMPFASIEASCPETAKLKDGLCFSTILAQIPPGTDKGEFDTLGAKVTVQAGSMLQDVDQYVLRPRGKRINTDKRMFKKAVMPGSQDCASTGQSGYQISGSSGQFLATPVQRVRCGPPMAPSAEAVYEFMGNEVFLITPGSCADTERLAHGCGGHIMNYMRQNGMLETQAIEIRGNYAIGTVVAFRGGGNIQYDIMRVTATPDFSQFKTSTLSRYQDGVNPSGGCRLPSPWIPGGEGIVISRSLVGTFYQWYSCPAR